MIRSLRNIFFLFQSERENPCQLINWRSNIFEAIETCTTYFVQNLKYVVFHKSGTVEMQTSQASSKLPTWYACYYQRDQSHRSELGSKVLNVRSRMHTFLLSFSEKEI